MGRLIFLKKLKGICKFFVLFWFVYLTKLHSDAPSLVNLIQINDERKRFGDELETPFILRGETNGSHGR